MPKQLRTHHWCQSEGDESGNQHAPASVSANSRKSRPVLTGAKASGAYTAVSVARRIEDVYARDSSNRAFEDLRDLGFDNRR